METMTTPERMTAVMMGKKPDRIPIIAFSGGYNAKLAGISLADYYNDPLACMKAQLHGIGVHGYDDAPSYGYADYGGWEFGGKIQFPEGYNYNAPRTIATPIDKPSDVDKLKVPNARTAGCHPIMFAFNKLKCEMGMPAGFTSGSSTTLVGSIIGKERLMRWFIKEPEAVKIVYDKVHDFLVNTADAMIEDFGLENVSAFWANPLDSNELISPRMFEKIVFPSLARLNKLMIDKGIMQHLYHVCGDHNGNLDILKDLPMPPRAIISISEKMSITKVAEAFGHRHVIAGNMSTSILAGGAARDAYNETKRCINEGKDLPGGFILMPACGMPVLTPKENIDAMMTAVREHGTYQ